MASLAGQVIGTAIGGPTGGQIGGAIGSSISGSSAAKKAASQQSAAANTALGEQAREFNITQANQQPFLSTGTAANSKLGYLLGTSGNLVNIDANGVPEANYELYKSNPAYAKAYSDYITAYKAQNGGQGFTPTSNVDLITGAIESRLKQNDPTYGSLTKAYSGDALTDDPGYQFRLQQGQQALDRSYAAKGGLLSGAAAKAASAYNSGQASQEYQNAYNRYNTDQTNTYNRLAGVSGTGQTAANTLASAGQNNANSQSELLLQQGNANAAGTVGSANAWSTGLNGLGSTLTNAYNSYTNPNTITWNSYGS